MIEEIRGPLQGLCDRLPGAVAATVMGFDGVPVDAVQAGAAVESVDFEELLIEYSTLLGQVRSSAQMLAAGALEELTISSERLVTLIRTINDEFFLAVAIQPSASQGKARFLCRVTAPRLLPVLE